MSLDFDSKYENIYLEHLSGKRAKGSLGVVFDIIYDLSDRRGLKQAWYQIDGEIQDEIIEKWQSIIDGKNGKLANSKESIAAPKTIINNWD